MNKTALLGILIAGLLGGGAFLMFDADGSDEIVVYKSPTCGCCVKWVEYLEKDGFDVEVRDMNDMQPVKLQHNIKREVQSCHTAVIDGYIVEGHVPLEYIRQMIEEKPDIKGLSVPGMPMGSPGMEGPNPVDYSVLAISKDGNKASVYAQVEAGV